MPQVVFRPKGLVTQPAPSAAPPGSLATASNVNLGRPGILTPRRGLGPTDASPSMTTVSKLIAALGGVYAFGAESSTWEMHRSSDGGATWSACTVPENSAIDTRYTDQATESRGNLYLGSDKGLYVFNGLSDTAGARAGRVRLPAGVCAESAATPAVYTAGSVFKYRMTLTRKDSNGVLTEGPPSGAFYHYDTALGTGGAVLISGALPAASGVVAAGDVVALYRSTLEATEAIAAQRSDLDQAVAFESRPYYSGSSVDGLTGYTGTSTAGGGHTGPPLAPRPPGEPNEELRLVKEYVLTSTDVSNKTFSITDTLPVSGVHGRSLYTNPSQGGANDTHHPPPAAYAVATFRDSLLLGNIRTPQEFLLRLLKVSGANWARGSDGIGYSTARTGDTTSGSAVVTDVSSTTNVEVGQIIVSANFPAGTRVLTVDSGTQVTATANATATTNNVALNFHDQITIGGLTFYAAAASAVITASVLASVVCVADDAQGTLAGISYLMGLLVGGNTATPWTDARAAAAGDLLVDGQLPSTTTFGVWGTRDEAWFTIKGTLPSTSAGALASEPQTYANAVAWCYPGEPEHWRWTYRRLGEAAKRVLAFSAVDDTVWVWKEDGLWRGTGDGYELRFDPFDLSLRLIHPDAVCTSDGVTYAWTNRGIVALTESGLTVISDPIANLLADITSQMALYPASSFGVWAVAYPSEGQVHFGIPATTGVASCATVYVWNTEVGGWTTHDVQAPTACHNPADDLMYVATGNSAVIRKTRRSFTSTAPDTYDAVTSVTVSSHTATSVTFSGSQSWTAGDALIQSSAVVAVFTSDGTGTTAPIDDGTAVADAAATLARGYTCAVTYADLSLGNPLTAKLFWETSWNFEDLRRGYSFTTSWASDVNPTAATQTTTRARDATAIPTPFRFGVPRSAARASRLRLGWSSRSAGAAWALGEAGVMFDLETERTRR